MALPNDRPEVRPEAQSEVGPDAHICSHTDATKTGGPLQRSPALAATFCSDSSNLKMTDLMFTIMIPMMNKVGFDYIADNFAMTPEINLQT